jgi:hypothetical protein
VSDKKINIRIRNKMNIHESTSISCDSMQMNGKKILCKQRTIIKKDDELILDKENKMTLNDKKVMSMIEPFLNSKIREYINENIENLKEKFKSPKDIFIGMDDKKLINMYDYVINDDVKKIVRRFYKSYIIRKKKYNHKELCEIFFTEELKNAIMNQKIRNHKVKNIKRIFDETSNALELRKIYLHLSPEEKKIIKMNYFLIHHIFMH